MTTKIHLADQTVDVAFKDVKNVHLSVLPPKGRVTITVPRRMELDSIRLFVISKLEWIRRQQRKIRGQEREPERELLDRESHSVWGQRYLLRVVQEGRGASGIELLPDSLVLTVRSDVDQEKRRGLLDAWYRDQVRAAVRPLIEKWEPVLGVKVRSVLVRRMKTRWGSCTSHSARILLNTELAKKPPECLEYVLVHEMIHLIERSHNAHFHALMDQFMPNWQAHRQALNRLPLRHENWEYCKRVGDLVG